MEKQQQPPQWSKPDSKCQIYCVFTYVWMLTVMSSLRWLQYIGYRVRDWREGSISLLRRNKRDSYRWQWG